MKWSIILIIYNRNELKKINFEETTPEGRNILHIACEKYLNKALIDEILDINYSKQTLRINLWDKIKSWSPLFYIIDSCDNGQPDIVQLLIKNGADLTVTDNKGVTPLHLASFHGQDENVEFLLKNGANIDSMDIYSRSPLTYAIIEGQTNVVQFLLKKGANINLLDINKNSLLHYAVNCKGNSLLYSSMLINKGINLNDINNEGNTPLMELIINNIAKENVRLTLLLIEKGAITEGIYNLKGQSFYSILGEEAEMNNIISQSDKSIKNKNILSTNNIIVIVVVSIIILLVSYLIEYLKKS